MDLPATALSLPRGLPFPITIQRIHAPPATQVHKTRTLLTYAFVPAQPDPEDGTRVRQVRQWESPIEGTVIAWNVRPGDLVRDNSQPVVHIQEPCTHDVQLQGLCALCGKDLTAVDYTGFSDTSRATISMVHDVGGLTVSLDEAHRLETATTTRLLQAKKLSLIVDLDQTIVHATVEPTVWEWMQDPQNPNHRALEGVKRFKLSEEGPARRRPPPQNTKKKKEEKKTQPRPADADGAGEEADDESSEDEDDDDDDEEDGCWYYIKMRPGLADFLTRVSNIYEMHVYTMGTRAYAKEVCKVIDPDGGLFGGRILSRDESGSLTRKSLQRLFPCDTNMVVIIDDRADVWDGSPHLVKVIPYEFFVGIGDINAAFLPKKRELVPPPPPPPPAAAASPSISPSSSPSPEPDSTDPAADTTTAPGRTTTPTDSPPPHALSVPLPEAIVAEPTTVSDLLVEPSSAADPDVVVGPALAEASTAAQHAIHDVMEARPLEKAAREAHEAHERWVQAHESSASEKSDEARPDDDGVRDEEAQTGTGENDADRETGEDEVEWGVEEAVLKDDDRELERVFDILSTVRNRFFEEHEAKGSADVATIIPDLKRLTLRDTHLVFSGLVALGTAPSSSEHWKLATTFGAQCSAELNPATTHLVASQDGTAKVHRARRMRRTATGGAAGAQEAGGVRIVYPQWLLDSVAHWRRLPEDGYLIPDPPPAATSAPGSPLRPELSAGDNDDDDDDVDPLRDQTGPRAGEDEADAEGAELDDAELHLEDLDWGDAMKEVDDLLLETDEEDTASVLGGGGGGGPSDGESDTSVVTTPGAGQGAARSPRKRPRGSTPSSSSGGGSGGSGPQEGQQITSASAESPLQKRVKTARSRRSGLKQSLSAAALERAALLVSGRPNDAQEGDVDAEEEKDGRATPSEAPSVASSSIASDDEDLLAMAADLEQGWT